MQDVRGSTAPSCQGGGARPRWIPQADGAFTGLGPDLRHASFGRRATNQGASVLPDTPWPTLRGLDARHPFAGGSRPGRDFALPWTPIDQGPCLPLRTLRQAKPPPALDCASRSTTTSIDILIRSTLHAGRLATLGADMDQSTLRRMSGPRLFIAALAVRRAKCFITDKKTLRIRYNRIGSKISRHRVI